MMYPRVVCAWHASAYAKHEGSPRLTAVVLARVKEVHVTPEKAHSIR